MSDGAKKAWEELQAEEKRTRNLKGTEVAKPKRPQRVSLRMSLERYYKIINWLKENKHRIDSSLDTQNEIRKWAEEELGFAVPITSLQKCGRIAHIKWPKSPTPPPPIPIEREAIIILMGAIAGLYVETGRTIPENLANLQTTYVQKQREDADAESDM